MVSQALGLQKVVEKAIYKASSLGGLPPPRVPAAFLGVSRPPDPRLEGGSPPEVKRGVCGAAAP
jgi:hypothetical protein